MKQYDVSHTMEIDRNYVMERFIEIIQVMKSETVNKNSGLDENLEMINQHSIHTTTQKRNNLDRIISGYPILCEVTANHLKIVDP